MLILFTCILLLFMKQICSLEQCQSVGDTDLEMVYMVMRHGDRTPDKSEVYLSNEPQKLLELSEKYGYMNLTNVGKARSFALGKHLRRRYNDILSPSYDPSNIVVICSETNRTIESGIITATGVYSPEDTWCKDMEMIPLEYTVLHDKHNYLMASASCLPFAKFCFTTFISPADQMRPYKDLLENLSRDLPKNLTEHPILLYGVYDLDLSQLSMGVPLKETHTASWDDMKQGAGTAIDVLTGNDDYLHLQAGVILKSFLDTADQIIAGTEVPRFTLYSAHDFTVYSFLAITRSRPKQGVPLFSSVMALELRKCRSDGKYVVVPVYISSPGDTEQYLSIEGCGDLCDLCDLDNFKKIVSNYTLDYEEYKQQCDIE